MRRFLFLFFLILILTYHFSQEESFFLAGVKVTLNASIQEEIKNKYIHQSIPVPIMLQKYVTQIHLIDQKVLNENYSIHTSGYTESYYQDGICVSSIIYLSNENFHQETLLHEVLHVYDSYQQISKEKAFAQLAEKEMDLSLHERIVKHYEKESYISEYFVESAFSVLLDSKEYQKNHPLTVKYIIKRFKEDQIIA